MAKQVKSVPAERDYHIFGNRSSLAQRTAAEKSPDPFLFSAMATWKVRSRFPYDRSRCRNRITAVACLRG